MCRSADAYSVFRDYKTVLFVWWFYDYVYIQYYSVYFSRSPEKCGAAEKWLGNVGESNYVIAIREYHREKSFTPLRVLLFFLFRRWLTSRRTSVDTTVMQKWRHSEFTTVYYNYTHCRHTSRCRDDISTHLGTHARPTFAVGAASLQVYV